MLHAIQVDQNLMCLSELDLKLNSETGGDLSTFIPNGEWEVIGEFKNNFLNIQWLPAGFVLNINPE